MSRPQTGLRPNPPQMEPSSRSASRPAAVRRSRPDWDREIAARAARPGAPRRRPPASSLAPSATPSRSRLASFAAVGAGLASGTGACSPVAEASGRLPSEGTCVAISVSSGGGDTVATALESGELDGRGGVPRRRDRGAHRQAPTAACVASMAAGTRAGAGTPSSEASAVPAASIVAFGPGLADRFDSPFVDGASVESAAPTGSRSRTSSGGATAGAVTAEVLTLAAIGVALKTPSPGWVTPAAGALAGAALPSDAFALRSELTTLTLSDSSPRCVRGAPASLDAATFSCLGACSWVGTAPTMAAPANASAEVFSFPVRERRCVASSARPCSGAWRLRAAAIRHRRPLSQLCLPGVSFDVHRADRIASPPLGARAEIFGFQAEEVLSCRFLNSALLLRLNFVGLRRYRPLCRSDCQASLLTCSATVESLPRLLRDASAEIFSFQAGELRSVASSARPALARLSTDGLRRFGIVDRCLGLVATRLV